MPPIQEIARGFLALCGALVVAHFFIYVGTAAYYSARSTYKKEHDHTYHDINVDFPPGLALLFKEWIEEYREMADAKRKGKDA